MFPNCLLVLSTLMVLSITGFSQLEAPDVAAPFTAEAPMVDGNNAPIITAEAPTVGDNLPPGYTIMLDNTTGEAYLVAENGTRTLAAKEILGPCGACCCGYRVQVVGEKGGYWEGWTFGKPECILNPECAALCIKSGRGQTGCRGEIVSPNL